MNHTQALEKLTGRCREQRKLANNTYLIRKDEDVAVRLHNTDVVTIHANGTYTLNSGTWRTLTTKDRINTYAPVRIHQEKGVWYMGDGSLFYDGMVVDADGVPLEPRQPDGYERKLKTIKKQAKEYATGYVAALKAGAVDYPSGGDCWFCLGRTVAGGNGSTEHIRHHIEEKYYVPSLLVNAGRDAGYRDEQIGLMGIGGHRLFIEPQKIIYNYVVKQLAKEL